MGCTLVGDCILGDGGVPGIGVVTYKGATHFYPGHPSQSSTNFPTPALPIGAKAIGIFNIDRATGGPLQ